jgi:hypothetical protein
VTRRRILFEGPDDRSALRELLTRAFSAGRRKVQPTSEKREELETPAGDVVELVLAGSRDQVLLRAADLSTYGSPSDPVVRVGLSFDPNGDPDWRAWIERGLAGRSPVRTMDGDWQLVGPGGPVLLVPLPWTGGDLHYGLPDVQNLERVAVHALAQAHAAEHALVARWLGEARGSGRTPSWKAAVRLWNALLHPDVAGAGFFDKVFGQDRSLGGQVRADLAGTELWRGLTLLTSP